ncbi:hypothetical protein ABID16_000280 [Rhizobium aquaticum]|uniref:Uncharacterized protein n=1 Tax=Rhizobium aquaticum TaxID=1549636 RepID=A0ABV2IW10_9HYPH
MPTEPRAIPADIDPTHSDAGKENALPVVPCEAPMPALEFGETDYLISISATFDEWESLEDEDAFSEL